LCGYAYKQSDYIFLSKSLVQQNHHTPLVIQCARSCFNPRSRAGSDANCYCFAQLHLSFNPRSRAGSDYFVETYSLYIPCFNPRSRAGSDNRNLSPQNDLVCFNPRSRAGSDVWKNDNLNIGVVFQSTLPCGERLLLT